MENRSCFYPVWLRRCRMSVEAVTGVLENARAPKGAKLGSVGVGQAPSA